jgi:hypothetical protein
MRFFLFLLFLISSISSFGYKFWCVFLIDFLITEDLFLLLEVFLCVDYKLVRWWLLDMISDSIFVFIVKVIFSCYLEVWLWLLVCW